MWMFRIACQPKFLPDQQSHFVTQLEKVVGFCNTTSPHTHQINAGLFGIAQFCISTFIRMPQHSFRYPVRSPDKDLLAIDIKLTGFVWCILIRCNFANTKTSLQRIRNLPFNRNCHLQFIQIRFTFKQRPPQPRIINFQLRKFFRGKDYFTSFSTKKAYLFLKNEYFHLLFHQQRHI